MRGCKKEANEAVVVAEGRGRGGSKSEEGEADLLALFNLVGVWLVQRRREHWLVRPVHCVRTGFGISSTVFGVRGVRDYLTARATTPRQYYTPRDSNFLVERHA